MILWNWWSIILKMWHIKRLPSTGWSWTFNLSLRWLRERLFIKLANLCFLFELYLIMCTLSFWTDIQSTFLRSLVLRSCWQAQLLIWIVIWLFRRNCVWLLWLSRRIERMMIYTCIIDLCWLDNSYSLSKPQFWWTTLLLYDIWVWLTFVMTALFCRVYT